MPGPFIAALDTVAGTCSFMLYAQLRNPDLTKILGYLLSTFDT